MRLGKDLLDKPLISVTDGRMVGRVKDLYLDNNLERIVGLYLGSEGIFNRNHACQPRPSDLFGVDAILASIQTSSLTKPGNRN